MDRPPAASDRYLTALTAVINTYLSGDLLGALAAVERMGGEFPERRVNVAHAQACLLCASGRLPRALDRAREVVASGSWWAPRKLADPDLVGLAELDGWDALVRTMSDRSELALDDARRRTPRSEVVAPSGRTARAAVVALHMYGVDAEETAAIWSSLADVDIAVVVPESRLLDGDGRPCWDDAECAAADVRAAVGEAGRVAPGAPLVLAGGSQGAGLAAQTALGGAVPECRGFICVAGGPEPVDVAGRLTSAPSGLRAALVVGSDDFARRPVEALHHTLAGSGVTCDLTVLPGVGHVYPPGWPELALDALGHVLGGDVNPDRGR